MKHDHHDRRPGVDVNHNPLARAQKEAPALNKAWFKDGERLTLFQRATFTFLSLFFLGFGLYLLHDVIDAIRADDRYGSALAFFVVVGLPILAMAIFGIRNVLRFPTEGEEHPDQLR
jgi:hypothetical protein